MNASPGLQSLLLKDIFAGAFFTEPVYLDSEFILNTPEFPFSDDLLSSLKEWGFKEVFSAGLTLDNSSDDDSGEIKTSQVTRLADRERVKTSAAVAAAFEKYVLDTFSAVKEKGALDYNALAERMKTFSDSVLKNKSFMLRACAGMETGENYMVSHTVKSTIYSLVIGSALKLPTYRLMELGVSALLHETGMLFLPPQVYLNDRALQPKEKELIAAHPLLAHKALKSFGIPLTIILPALEHHERENGQGYPRRLLGNRLSLYSKIISVACSFEALSSYRPYKAAKDSHAGILELLQNDKKQYDDTVVKALVYSLSLYPIGSNVLLSNGKQGQVIDVNPELPRYPIVQLLGDYTPDKKTRIIATSRGGVSIARALASDEVKAE